MAKKSGKKVEFYYVRHGRTEFNRDGIIQGGRVDSPLVTDSLDVIRQSADVLRNVPFCACYCSPLGRAQQTAKILLDGRSKIPVHTLENLREFDFGTLDGQPYKGNRMKFVRCFTRQDFSPYGGESGDQVRERLRNAFKKMYRSSSDGDKVLVVAHGALFRYAVLEFSPASAASRKLMSETMQTPNAGIGLITCQDGKFLIEAMPLKAQKFAAFMQRR
ncbi:MAG: histidine phosphatase family protein [Atopobiaceae bacterium]